MVKLGDKAKDGISGFVGIVTGRAEYLYGCVQVLLAPMKLDKDGKVPDSLWLDEDRVAVMRPAARKRPPSVEERAGGPLTGPIPPGR